MLSLSKSAARVIINRAGMTTAAAAAAPHAYSGLAPTTGLGTYLANLPDHIPSNRCVGSCSTGQ